MTQTEEFLTDDYKGWDPLDETRNVVLASDALLQELPDGEAVILHMGSEVYYSLDGVALDMWKAIGEADSLAEAREHLASLYEVNAETLANDIRELVVDLESRGLVQII
ncbi:MAG: PqqD family protein [Acidimicrobiia bacterium]|nr:PqqD family protein [Acidimicrobiia bacterium]